MNTINKWTLKNDYKSDKDFVFHYESDLGHLIKFQAHPTKSSYVFLESSEGITQKEANKLIEAYTIYGMCSNQNDFANDIKVLVLSDLKNKINQLFN